MRDTSLVGVDHGDTIQGLGPEVAATRPLLYLLWWLVGKAHEPVAPPKVCGCSVVEAYVGYGDAVLARREETEC